jgi:hypothetical protein
MLKDGGTKLVATSIPEMTVLGSAGACCRSEASAEARTNEGRLPRLRWNRPVLVVSLRGLETHATHLVPAAGGRRSGLFGLVGDDDLCSQEQRRNRCGVLQCRARNLGGVDDALRD